MTQDDYNELKRLEGLGMKRVLCDISGQSGAVDDLGHIELVPEGLLMEVTPFSTLTIQDALSAGGE